MNSDLISRSELKKAIENYLSKRQDVIIWETDMFNMLNNAQTVEISKIEHKAYNEGFKDGVDQGIKLSASQKGEWITKGYEPYGRCNICGEICEINNFCGYCGADMREGYDGQGSKNETNQCR